MLKVLKAGNIDYVNNL